MTRSGALVRHGAVTAIVVIVGMCAIVPTGASEVSARLQSDVRYATHGGVQLFLDAYLPPGGGPAPAVLVFHGGRWAYGDKLDLSGVALDLVADGFAAFSVNYRLVPEWPFPAAVEDAQAAVAWVRAHAHDLGVDPDRIGAFGGSAGGYLAAALATFGSGDLQTGARVSAAATWSAPLDLEPLLVDDNPAVPTTIAAFLGCVPEPGCAERARGASPVTHVDPTDAPLFIANASEEAIPLEQALSMASAYDRVGVAYELAVPESTGHGLNNAGPLMGPTIRFFEERLTRRTGTARAPITPSIAPAPTSPGGAVPAADQVSGGDGADWTWAYGVVVVLSLLVVTATTIQVVLVAASVRRVAADRARGRPGSSARGIR